MPQRWSIQAVGPAWNPSGPPLGAVLIPGGRQPGQGAGCRLVQGAGASRADCRLRPSGARHEPAPAGPPLGGTSPEGADSATRGGEFCPSADPVSRGFNPPRPWSRFPLSGVRGTRGRSGRRAASCSTTPAFV